MFRIEWHMADGARCERYCSAKEEAASVFNNALFAAGVKKVLIYERQGFGQLASWKLLKIGIDGELLADD